MNTICLIIASGIGAILATLFCLLVLISKTTKVVPK